MVFAVARMRNHRRSRLFLSGNPSTAEEATVSPEDQKFIKGRMPEIDAEVGYRAWIEYNMARRLFLVLIIGSLNGVR